MSDTWEALFRIWHIRSHKGAEILEDIKELERRIVKLEAYVNARRKARRTAWEFANVLSGTSDVDPGTEDR